MPQLNHGAVVEMFFMHSSTRPNRLLSGGTALIDPQVTFMLHLGCFCASDLLSMVICPSQILSSSSLSTLQHVG